MNCLQIVVLGFHAPVLFSLSSVVPSPPEELKPFAQLNYLELVTLLPQVAVPWFRLAFSIPHCPGSHPPPRLPSVCSRPCSSLYEIPFPSFFSRLPPSRMTSFFHDCAGLTDLLPSFQNDFFRCAWPTIVFRNRPSLSAGRSLDAMTLSLCAPLSLPSLSHLNWIFENGPCFEHPDLAWVGSPFSSFPPPSFQSPRKPFTA